MSTIPLIASQPTDELTMPRTPLEAYARAVSLQGMLEQNQALAQKTQQSAESFPVEQQQQQQVLQQQQQENALREQAMKDQQIMRTLAPQFVKRSDDGMVNGFDVNGFAQTAAQQGVSPTTISDYQSKYAQGVEANLKLSDAERKQQEENVGKFGGMLEDIKPITDPAARQKSWESALMEAHRRKVDISSFPMQVPDNNGISALEIPLGLHAQLQADAKTQSEIAKNLRENTASQLESKYLEIQQKKNLKQALTPAEAAFSQAYEHNKTLVPVANFNLQAGGVPLSGAPKAATTGASGQQLQAAVPANIKPTVLAVLEGRQSPPGGFALKSPYWQNVMNNVYALDPEWNEQRAQLRKAYTLGPQSKEINAINTAMGHVGVLGDAIDALNNGDVRILNSIANRLGLETGSTPQAVFKTIVHRVGPELSKAYLGAGGSAGERGADEKDFDVNLPPQTLKANVGVTAQLLRSKIGSLENQWDQNAAPGVQSFQERFITKEAQKQLDKWSPESGASSGKIRARDPQGHLHEASAGTALPPGWKLEP